MFKPLMRSVAAGALLLAAAAAPSARAGTTVWERKANFAKRLAKDRGYWDLSQMVREQILQDPSIKGTEKAHVHRAIGEMLIEVIEDIRGKDALQRITEHLAEARKHFRIYADDPAVRGKEEFEVKRRLAWLLVNQARVLASMLDNAEVPKTEHPKLKAESVAAYNAAIKEFDGLAKGRKAEEDKTKAAAPKEKEAREKWERRYSQVRTEHVGIRILLNDTRVELAKFLKKTGSDPKDWRSLLENAVRDYKAMLYEFSGAGGIMQINVKYAEAIVELDPKNDAEAIGRLDEVWKNKASFGDNKEVPCRAMHIKAAILLRQKKHDEAIATLDEMIAARTGDWEPGKLKIDLVGAKVTDILRNLEDGEIERQYSARALAQSFLLAADTYAAWAKAAEDAKKPGKEVERLYGMAYELAIGVFDARMRMDPKYPGLIELWRKKGRRPISLAALQIQIAQALDKASRLREKEPEASKAEYHRAARLYTEVIARTRPEIEQLRKIWVNVAKCYYAAADYYAAYHVFTAMSRWFPRPAPQAEEYALSAIAAIKTQLDLDVKAKAEQSKITFENAVLRAAYLNYEAVIGQPGLATIAEGRDLRRDKDYRGAIAAFQRVLPESPVYAIARYEIAITAREMFLALPQAEQKAAGGQKVLKDCLDAFEASLAAVRKRLPELKGEDRENERKRMLDTAVSCMTIYCETLLKDYVGQPSKVIDLTANLKDAYPGIGDTANYGFIVYMRMHAAHALATGTDVAAATKALDVIEETWKAMRGFPGFKYLANAAKMGGIAYNELAKRLEAQAQKTADPKDKEALLKRVGALRSRSLDFYLDLLNIAPYQPLGTYRYVLYELDRRDSEVKSADYRKIIEIAPKALEMFRDDEAPLDQLAQMRIIYATAHARLGQWRDAIPILEAVDAAYEVGFRARMKKYDADKKRSDEDPQRFPPPRRPIRYPIHVQAREALGRAYIETKAKSKAKEAVQIYVDQVNANPNRQSPKHWEGMFYLIEASRMGGEYDNAIRYLFRAATVMEDNPVKAGVGTKKDFVDLAARLGKEIETSADPSARKRLLDSLQEILKKLGR